MRVLHIVYGLGMGGAETWLVSLIRMASKRDDLQFDILVTCGETRVFDEELKQLGAKIHYAKYDIGSVFSFRRKFRRILKHGNYDVIHDHQDLQSGFHFLLAGGGSPGIRITHVHNPFYQLRDNYGVTIRRRLTARLGLWLVRRYATYILGTSNQLLDEYGFTRLSFGAEACAALYCGFDVSEFLGEFASHRRSLRAEMSWPEDSRVVLFAGRLDHSPDKGAARNHKNSGFAIEILIASMKRDKSLRAVFAGAPSVALPVLVRRVEDCGLAGNIKFLGVRRDIPRLMMGSDVLLFPSRAEGLGMVAVEAQAAGLPVVASTAVPQEVVVCPGIVKFVDLETPLEAWVEALLQAAYINSDKVEANIAVRASEFSIENSMEALLAVYGGEKPRVTSFFAKRRG